MVIKETEAKTILVKSKLPDTDYVVNPYTGCQFACAYCYASFMGRFVDEPIANWGNYVYVKRNAVGVFAAELKKLRARCEAPSILLSSVTDPYQGVEHKYRLTRGILEELAKEPYPGLVSILTKSPMVTRDIDLFRSLPRVEVGMTVTTTDDTLGRFLEVHAPLTSSRLATLDKLAKSGIETYAFVGPLLPHLRFEPDALDALFAGLAKVGVKSLFVEQINLKPYIQLRMSPLLKAEPPTVQSVYSARPGDDHHRVLDEMVQELLKRYGLRLRLGEVIEHNRSRPEHPGRD